ncbi:glycosyltransferase family 2 protein [Halorubrum ezzemoulense]|uniref:glycosyltransferase family 2 protein n=1 Tax=Halorubrum ezzemoulense TaxID=337243 RepID=UPI00232EAEF7|nr:glycosyltransferase family 2 protein [Halorubrum ezzemoulense]MDB9250752.1 glycosyltransferase family 2 protein [Halorubrum ezzemoulense]MDB9260881.1 glycosyltransferase family 2 protein [Halorubrum ezzemoulense]MDB9264289.1 glycosyltransferase family 2 protein [Halorubrum ezzemoulense]MDB9267781.1 glycosyltransferase family 2 protein [Halorubrum ezzemoulense]MDB9271242.1 glycosyltransferase family 2 protein [Halorubrum ezzemoulense]
MADVSVVIPTYNRSEFIKGAVETALNQTYEDLEVVVVNDGSTDDTRSELGAYEDRSDVTVLHNDRNQGISYSRNRGTKFAEGEYICILDDDDRWEPEKVEKQVSLMEQLGTDYAVVYTGGVVIDDDRNVVQQFNPSRSGDIYPEVLARWKLNPHSGHMIRKACFEDVGGFDPDLVSGVDWDLSIRLAKKYKFEYIDEPLVKRIVHGDNISDTQRHANMRGDILEKYNDEITKHPRIHRTFLARWDEVRGWAAIKRGDHKNSIKYYYRALKREPTSHRILYFLLALAGPSVFTIGGRVRRGFYDTFN